MTQPGSGAEGIALAAADRLARRLEDVVAESKALRADVAVAERQRGRELRQQAAQIQQRAAESRRQRWALIIIAGLLAIVGLVALQNRGISRDAAESAGAARTTSAQLQDCVVPTGTCYRNGQARTGRAVLDISRTQLYIVECARALPVEEYPPGPKFDAAFERCVAARLALPPAVPKPSPSPSPSPARSPAGP